MIWSSNYIYLLRRTFYNHIVINAVKMYMATFLQSAFTESIPYPNFQVHLLSIKPNKYNILVSPNVHHKLELTLHKLDTLTKLIPQYSWSFLLQIIDKLSIHKRRYYLTPKELLK